VIRSRWFRRRWRAVRAACPALIALGFLLPARSGAQRSSIPVLIQPNRSGPILAGRLSAYTDWPRIDLNILVLDRSGNPAPRPDPAALQILDDGVPQSIQSVTAAGSPVSLGLMIDSSGSAYANRPQVRDAAIALASSLPPGSEAAIIFFADQAFCDLPFTPVSAGNTGPVLSVMQHMDARGGTAFFDALIATEDYFVRNAHNARRALVVISDAGENASTHSLRETIADIQYPGAPILYVLNTTDPRDSPSRMARLQHDLKAIVDAGGGLIVPAHQTSDIASAAARISALIQSQIALSYRTTSPAASGDPHRLDVRLTANPAKLVIFGEPELYAPVNYSSE